MRFKSDVQPLCRYCGEKIKKSTHTHFFGRREFKISEFGWTDRPERPQSKEEAQRLLNQKIVSLSWSLLYVEGESRRDYIDKVTTWDGESWMDEFFCKGDHAQRFGYAAARADKAMPAYNEAIVKRRETENA